MVSLIIEIGLEVTQYKNVKVGGQSWRQGCDSDNYNYILIWQFGARNYMT